MERIARQVPLTRRDVEEVLTEDGKRVNVMRPPEDEIDAWLEAAYERRETIDRVGVPHWPRPRSRKEKYYLPAALEGVELTVKESEVKDED